mmetsp:Transcript_4202/g.13502  ORF Transcript_4202/g.13502 Transcript_4202/m.13502 type:complete len:128 (-) Transcript_4202:44-427(-)
MLLTSAPTYYTLTDKDPLQDDEFIVESLLDRKGRGDNRCYLVKWRGYARSSATWEPMAELMRRCASLVADYDAAHPFPPACKSQMAKRATKWQSQEESALPRPTAPEPRVCPAAAASDRVIPRLSHT